ncbi:MAG TPA: 3-dehydroquinate synthase, partial [Coriobacteriia bacterium]
GAFWQPILVVADLGTLASLPEAEWLSGLAEVAKAGILDSEPALARLEADAPALCDREPASVARAVRMAAGLKVRIVSADEREVGARASLNYGHTLGHAIERVAGYGVVAHGLAVAEGMRFAAMMAERSVHADRAWTQRQEALLGHLGLPATGCPWPAAELAAAVRADKKVRRGRVRLVLTTRPGEWSLVPIDDASVESALEEWCGPSDGGRRRR